MSDYTPHYRVLSTEHGQAVVAVSLDGGSVTQVILAEDVVGTPAGDEIIRRVAIRHRSTRDALRSEV